MDSIMPGYIRLACIQRGVSFGLLLEIAARPEAGLMFRLLNVKSEKVRAVLGRSRPGKSQRAMWLRLRS